MTISLGCALDGSGGRLRGGRVGATDATVAAHTVLPGARRVPDARHSVRHPIRLLLWLQVRPQPSSLFGFLHRLVSARINGSRNVQQSTCIMYNTENSTCGQTKCTLLLAQVVASVGHVLAGPRGAHCVRQRSPALRRLPDRIFALQEEHRGGVSRVPCCSTSSVNASVLFISFLLTSTVITSFPRVHFIICRCAD